MCPPGLLGGWQAGGGGGESVMNVLTVAIFCTGCIIAGRTVAKRDCLIPEISPGRIKSRIAGKEIGGNTHYSEEGVLGRSEHGPEELLNVVYCKMRVTSGA
jgi:hypothetical protein